MRRELCEFAKRGSLCIDDLCHGCDITLCGFDRAFYEREILMDYEHEMDYEQEDDGCPYCGTPRGHLHEPDCDEMSL